MIIKKYDEFKNKNRSFILFNAESVTNFFYLTLFLFLRFGYVKRDGVLNYLEKNKLGMMFEEVNLDIDNKNNLVYFSEIYKDGSKEETPEIDALLEEENFIELCKMGFLDYVVMTKENFIHLLLAWDKILSDLPPFALLYLDDQNWYEVLPFDTQEAMEQFVADHTKVENLEK